MNSSIPLPFPKAKTNPGQIKAYDNADDRPELGVLLGHLSPERRVEFLRWVCLNATFPGTHRNHPIVAKSTIDLASYANRCDRASESLTMDVITSLVHMGIDYSLDFSKCLAHLVLMARGRDSRD